ncbi:unnamed protein product [Rangifer tarandus platyrhynchus]|uniref:ABC transporter domain-containing protein n=1 Tax=Rangifer tarandus platyrhynchus TaxID=3082113 RepID=A0ABN9A1I3_RANTA|nr:unnamed protein product [Rangifer tarandus platyrhynchus]
MQPVSPEEKPNPPQKANVCSRLFSWYGDQEVLRAKTHKWEPSLMKAIVKCYWKSCLVLGIFTFLEEGTKVVQPIFYGKMVSYVENCDPANSAALHEAYGYEAGLSACVLVWAVLYHLYFCHIQRNDVPALSVGGATAGCRSDCPALDGNNNVMSCRDDSSHSSSAFAKLLRDVIFITPNFLLLDEIPEVNTQLPSDGEVMVDMQDFTAFWDEESETPTLQGLSFTVRPGERLAVVGPVGAGKSSLLSALLGELPPSQGKVSMLGRIAYVSQLPWVFPGTVKSNILFGKKYEEERYEEVIKACALKEVSNDS